MFFFVVKRKTPAFVDLTSKISYFIEWEFKPPLLSLYKAICVRVNPKTN